MKTAHFLRPSPNHHSASVPFKEAADESGAGGPEGGWRQAGSSALIDSAPSITSSISESDTVQFGSDRRDYMFGGAGDDTLFGGAGDDRLSGGSGDDVLFGDSGRDELIGSEDDDLLVGGADDDILRDDFGTNVLLGGDGADRFLNVSGSAAENVLLGGTGEDIFVIGHAFDPTASAAVVMDFETGSGGDTIVLYDLLLDIFGPSGVRPNPFASGHLRLEAEAGQTVLKASLTGGQNPSDLRPILILHGVEPAALTAENFVPPYEPIRIGSSATEGDDALSGTPASDVIDGLGGNDTISGFDGNDLLIGGAGDDFLSGGGGDDTLLGGSGVDQLHGGDGNDRLEGSDGADSLYGDAGNDLLNGGDGPNLLDGGLGDDTLVGGLDRDYLSGGEGTNTIYGNGGDDQILAVGRNIIDGGSGSDRYLVNDFPSAAQEPDVFKDFEPGRGGDVIDLAGAITALNPTFEEAPWLEQPFDPFKDGLLRIIASDGDTLVQVDRSRIGAGEGFVTIVRLENVAPHDLSAFNFNPPYDPFGRIVDLTGTEGNDTLVGSLGNDRIAGLDGDDILSGGRGDDLIEGGEGNDRIFGGEHNDTLLGGSGDDHIYGDPDFYGSDPYSPPKPAGNDYIDGGDGNDTFYDYQSGSYGGSNTIVGGAGDDVFYYASGHPSFSDVYFSPIQGVDYLTGGEGRDTYRLENALTGVADVVTDFATGPSGDFIDISILLQELPGYLPGSNPFTTGFLILEASDSGTLLRATSPCSADGYQTVLVMENTRLEDFTPDNFQPAYAPNGHDIIGSDGADELNGTPWSEFLDGLAGNDVIVALDGEDRLEGGDGNDILDGGDGDDLLYGAEGDDTLLGGNGNDNLSGGAGNNRLEGGNGQDTILGHNGDDLIIESDGPAAAGNNDDFIMAGGGNDFIQAGAGDDYVDGGPGDDTIYGGSGDDGLFDNFGQNVIDGGGGNDFFYNVSSNLTYGYDAPGSDLLWGGEGQDRFSIVFDATQPMVLDRIQDFEAGARGDIIDVSQITHLLSGYVSGSDPFEIGLLRLSAGDGDTILEAQLAPDAFSPILILEDILPGALTFENIDYVGG